MACEMNLQLLLDDFSTELKNRSGNLTEDSVRYYLFACMLRQDSQLNNYMLELPYDLMISSKASNGLPVNIDKQTIPNGDQGKGFHNLELDMCYYNGSQCFSIEIKFHRHNNKSHAFPHTMSAGSLFNDLRRLELIQPNPLIMEYDRLFLYVTDQEMHNYLVNDKNTVSESDDDCDELSQEEIRAYRSKLRRFYTLEPGTSDRFTFEYDEALKDKRTTPMSFMDAANKSFPKSKEQHENVDVSVRKLYDSDLLSGSPSLKEATCHVRLYSVKGRCTKKDTEEK